METRHISTDFDLCYRAICSRDLRFDGRFFVAVTTTGVYCRPICPAPTPHAPHVRFYSCAAAAEAAGFRACRRCHPEASPGSPDWNVRADLVARALRLIADGVVDTEGVAGLAHRLAVSERHLHRELVAEVGVGPLALARTRRAQTARLLIDQTDLSLTIIACTAGFASIRQFNETMQAAFGCTPSAFRRRVPPENRGEGKLTLRLHYRPPLDAALLLAYLRQRALPGVEDVSEGCYRRTVTLPHSCGVIELEPLEKTNAILLRVQLDALSDLSMLVQRCRQLLDLEQPHGVLTHFFPSPQVIAQADMQGLGLTRSRVNALQALAHAVIEDGLVLDRAADRERTMRSLRLIPGVGPWTSSYIAMRVLGDPDAFPVTDLGLRHAFEQRGVATDASSAEKRAEAWRPWRAYAAQHLWANLPGAQHSTLPYPLEANGL